MKLSQLVDQLISLEYEIGGNHEVKLRVDDENSFGPEMDNFFIERRVNDVVLVADKAELILEIEDEND